MTILSGQAVQLRGRILRGVVVSDKMDKGIVVKVEYYGPDSRVGKFIRTFKRFPAHDESNSCKAGDRVEIQECPPYSKTKSWRLLNILEKTK
jgi:small subunit ribosomal protein S17